MAEPIMDAKTMLGCMALAAMALAPLGVAHMDMTAAYTPIPLPSTSGWGANRVSGVYYGSVAAFTEHRGYPLEGQPTSFAFGVGRMQCDLEVFNVGDSSGEPEDEVEIDGVSTTGSMPTNFNDGGVGGVCHTHQGYYPNEDFNTAGCVYDLAMGADALQPDVWLTTVCNYAHSTDGVGLFTHLVDCLEITDCLKRLDTCGPNLGDYCATAARCVIEGGCSALASSTSCGPNAEGQSDVQAVGGSGWGSEGVPFPSMFSDPFFECDVQDMTAAVFVQNAVIVDTQVLSAWSLSPTMGVIY